MTASPTFTVGLISDTHGLLRPEALDALAGSDHIVHAGDIGRPEILAELELIAPVIAVRGNNDFGPWAEALPLRTVLHVGGLAILVVHDQADLKRDPPEDGVRVVVCGHSHQPSCAERNGIWYVNPGSAGPRRFHLPISAGRIIICGEQVEPQWFELL